MPCVFNHNQLEASTNAGGLCGRAPFFSFSSRLKVLEVRTSLTWLCCSGEAGPGDAFTLRTSLAIPKAVRIMETLLGKYNSPKRPFRRPRSSFLVDSHCYPTPSSAPASRQSVWDLTLSAVPSLSVQFPQLDQYCPLKVPSSKPS